MFKRHRTDSSASDSSDELVYSSPVKFSTECTVSLSNSNRSQNVSLLSLSQSGESSMSQPQQREISNVEMNTYYHPPSPAVELIQEDTCQSTDVADTQDLHTQDANQSQECYVGDISCNEEEEECVLLNQSLENANCGLFDESDSEVSADDTAGSDCLDSSNGESEDSSSEDEDERDCFRTIEDPFIYKGASIRVSESYAAILSYILRHPQDSQQIADLLELISLHCGFEENHFKPTLYFFKKHFANLNVPLKYHYFCSGCFSKLDSGSSKCLDLRKHPKTSSVSFLVEIPLIPQLKSLFSKQSFYESLNHRFAREKENESNIEDIYDGQLYKEFTESGFLGPNKKAHFTLMFNSDGIPVFKSTKASLWPLYFVVNELPYKLRFKQENMILGALWFGANPLANFILQPFLDSLKEVLHGFEVLLPNAETTVARGLLLAGTCDIPAKAKFMGMKQSGAFGCQVCKHSGDKVSVVKKKSTAAGKKKRASTSCNTGDTRIMTVYKYKEMVDLRRHNETASLGEKTLCILKSTKDIDIEGVKHPSFLFKIMPDVIRGMAIDDLHTIYLGVEKKLMSLWFDAAHNKEDFSIRKFIPLVDERISGIRLPNFVQRQMRRVGENEIVHWKAKEFMVWMLHASLIVLSGILPDKYLENYVDLVVAIYILSAKSISPDDLLESDKMLQQFIKGFQDLYGEKHMSIVVHLLQHLVFQVTNLGPLWSTSCFPFESMNGHLLKMVHGTKYVHTQVANCAFLFMRFHEHLEKLSCPTVKEFCSTIMHPSSRLKISEKIDDEVFSVGKYKLLTEVPTFMQDGLLSLGISVEKCNLFSFLKVKKSPYLFVCKDYSRAKKNVSHMCSYNDLVGSEKFGSISVFLKIACKDCESDCNCVPKFCCVIQESTSQPYIVGSKLVPHIHRLSIENRYTVVPIKNIQKMLFSVSIDSNNFVSKPNNMFLAD